MARLKRTVFAGTIFSRTFFAIFGAALIYLSAQFEMSIPGSPVPQSAQTLAILLVAVLLPKPYGILAVTLYLLAGLLGLPVFSDGGHGWSHLTGKTGGYLFGFLIAVVWIQNLDRMRRPLLSFAHYLIAHGFILLFGWLYLSRSTGFSAAWEHGVSPFLIGALVKSFIALIIVYGIKYLYEKGINSHTKL